MEYRGHETGVSFKIVFKEGHKANDNETKTET